MYRKRTLRVPLGHLPLLLRCRKGHSRLDAPLPDRLVADVNLTVPPPQLCCRTPKRSGRHCSFNRICPHRFTHPLPLRDLQHLIQQKDKALFLLVPVVAALECDRAKLGHEGAGRISLSTYRWASRFSYSKVSTRESASTSTSRKHSTTCCQTPLSSSSKEKPLSARISTMTRDDPPCVGVCFPATTLLEGAISRPICSSRNVVAYPRKLYSHTVCHYHPPRPPAITRTIAGPRDRDLSTAAGKMRTYL